MPETGHSLKSALKMRTVNPGNETNNMINLHETALQSVRNEFHEMVSNENLYTTARAESHLKPFLAATLSCMVKKKKEFNEQKNNKRKFKCQVSVTSVETKKSDFDPNL